MLEHHEEATQHGSRSQASPHTTAAAVVKE
ncbi:hypothetical protein HaLaN_04518, partial [Haematococcus lacustris]